MTEETRQKITEQLTSHRNACRAQAEGEAVYYNNILNLLKNDPDIVLATNDQNDLYLYDKNTEKHVDTRIFRSEDTFFGDAWPSADYLEGSAAPYHLAAGFDDTNLWIYPGSATSIQTTEELLATLGAYGWKSLGNQSEVRTQQLARKLALENEIAKKQRELLQLRSEMNFS